MSLKPCVPSTFSNGFTLIEVIAALVIFSGGVLMVIQVSGSLSSRMEWAATASEVVVVAQARLDSLETVPFDSLTEGTAFSAVTVQNKGYYLITKITRITELLVELNVSIRPGYGVTGPSYATSTYVAGRW